MRFNKIISFTIILFLLVTYMPFLVDDTPVSATNTSATYPGTASGWTNSNNIKVDDSSWATFSVQVGPPSASLLAYNFGFSSVIGETDDIDGITVNINKKANSASSLTDNTLYLRDSTGATVGDNKASATYWSTTVGGAVATYTWTEAQVDSATIDATDIRDSDFGIDFTAINYAESAVTASIDYVTIVISYTAGGNDAPTQTSHCIWDNIQFINKTINATGGVAISPYCINVTINDVNGNKMNVTIRTNATLNGETKWRTVNATTLEGSSGHINGTYEGYNTSWISTWGTKYWISFNLTDGTNWVNKTRYFVTRASPTVWIRTVTNNSKQGTAPTIWVQINTTSGFSSDVYFLSNCSTGVWTVYQKNTSVSTNTSLNWTFDEASSVSTNYWWRVNCTQKNDGSPNSTSGWKKLTTANYTKQTPPSSNQWDSVYEDNTLINAVNVSISASATDFYESYPEQIFYRLIDRDPASRWYEDSATISDSAPIRISYNLYNATNISWFRWYYHYEDGLGACPTKYAVYNSSTFIQEFEVSATVNGQWVRCDLSSEIKACSNFTLKINHTVQSETVGNPTDVSLAELQIFNGTDNLFLTYRSKNQGDVIGFEDIPYWWNGLQWAVTLRMDDIRKMNDTEVTEINRNLMPITAGFEASPTNDNNAWVDIDSYHVEIAGHLSGFAVDSWYAGHTEAEDTNTTLTNLPDEISAWSTNEALTHHWVSSLIYPGTAFGAYAGGLRVAGTKSNTRDVYSTWNHSWQGLSFSYRDGQNFSNYNITFPVNPHDMLALARWGSTMKNGISEDWVSDLYVPSFWNKSRDNGSWYTAYVHPLRVDGAALFTEFRWYIENDTTGWHCLEGEAVSYINKRAYTIVEYNTSTNSSHIVYDLEDNCPDTKVWDVPITFKFNRTEISWTGEITVRWQGNDTTYNDTLNNISLFPTSSGTSSYTGSLQHHINQTMREGYRIDGDYLYVSVIPQDKSIILSRTPTNSLPELTGSVYPTTGIDSYTLFYFNCTWADADGDSPGDNPPTTYLKVNISRAGWYVNTSMTWISGSNTTGALYQYTTTLTTSTGYSSRFYAYDGTDYNSTTADDNPDVEAQSYTLGFGYSSGSSTFWCNFTSMGTYGTQYNVSMQGQHDTRPALNITNQGNVPINITIKINTAPGSGLTLKWDDDNDPTGATTMTTDEVLIEINLAVGNTETIWMWMDYLNASPGSGERTLTITSKPGD